MTVIDKSVVDILATETISICLLFARTQTLPQTWANLFFFPLPFKLEAIRRMKTANANQIGRRTFVALETECARFA